MINSNLEIIVHLHGSCNVHVALHFMENVMPHETPLCYLLQSFFASETTSHWS